MIKENRGTIIKISLLVMLFWGQLCTLNFAVDTYYNFSVGFHQAAEETFNGNFRVVLAVFYKIFAVTGLPNEFFYYISYFVAIIFLISSVFCYEKVLEKYILNTNICIFLSFISIVNLFIVEYFMFIEKGAFMIGIFFNVLIVYYIQRYIETSRLRYIVASIILSMLTIMTYQGIICLFFILALPIIFYNSSNIFRYTKFLVLLSAIYFLPVVFELLVFKLFFNSYRAGSSSDIVFLEEIKKHLRNLNHMFTGTFGIVPKYWFATISLLLIVGTICGIVIKRERVIMNIINVIVIVLSCLVIPCAALVGSTGWEAPRIVYPMASLIGVLAINYCINVYHDSDNKIIIIVKNGVVLSSIIIFAISYVGFMKISNDRYKSNYADKIRILEIGQAIREYEEETGNRVSGIAFYTDANHDEPYYSGLNDESDFAVSSFHSWDSQLNAINYYLGTEYKRREGTSWFIDYYSQYDWHGYSKKQIEFNEKTLHYCVY